MVATVCTVSATAAVFRTSMAATAITVWAETCPSWATHPSTTPTAMVATTWDTALTWDTAGTWGTTDTWDKVVSVTTWDTVASVTTWVTECLADTTAAGVEEEAIRKWRNGVDGEGCEEMRWMRRNKADGKNYTDWEK